MLFNVLKIGVEPPESAKLQAYLLTDGWDDWFKYNTLYHLVVFDQSGQRHDIGGLKIGQFGMKAGQKRPNVPSKFDNIGDEFFSLGQDDSYYENLNEISNEIRDDILQSLRDLALNEEIFSEALLEDVTGISLLRSVTISSVRGQFRRLALGGARLSRYEFRYIAPSSTRKKVAPFELEFNVKPESQPPTNVHVLIGRNGVGKTRLLYSMSRAIVFADQEDNEYGTFAAINNQPGETLFSNIVSVTFSAFDPFEPLPVRQDRSEGIQYFYIGLKHTGKSKEGKVLPPKSVSLLSSDFVKSVKVCSVGARAPRWKRALEMLEADPIFKEAEVANLTSYSTDEELKSKSSSLFGNLSSGHKIVLLTITRLVETVEERTLVLMDEPEAHLHPPLLSAFIRALSDLLIDRNGVAIVATHSPVILQEVPKSCVWRLSRTGHVAKARRPLIETFGENVGILTREIFGLEVTHSGFHRLIEEKIEGGDSFDDVIHRFNGEIGAEARAILRALIVANTSDEQI